ncbi:hypothetical protein CDAR_603301, partial [Caerostris darwini]
NPQHQGWLSHHEVVGSMLLSSNWNGGVECIMVHTTTFIFDHPAVKQSSVIWEKMNCLRHEGIVFKQPKHCRHL